MGKKKPLHSGSVVGSVLLGTGYPGEYDSASAFRPIPARGVSLLDPWIYPVFVFQNTEEACEGLRADLTGRPNERPTTV